MYWYLVQFLSMDWTLSAFGIALAFVFALTLGAVVYRVCYL